MKSRFSAITAAVSVAAALSVFTAGQAVARTYQPSHASSQVNGTKLLGALLPAGAFGGTFYISAWLYTPRLLAATRSALVSRLSCAAFENSANISGFGNTAGATDEFTNTDPWPQYPETVFYGFQTVLQFANDGAASSFFGQARAKYAACRSFSAPNPGDRIPGGGSYVTSLVSVTSTELGHDRAFAVVESVALSERPGVTFYLDVLYVTAGTNVYAMWQISGMNDQSPLMPDLIGRVRALYSGRLQADEAAELPGPYR